jgi:hypothetical protein
MKATLEFLLPEESEEHNRALMGSHYKNVIDETFTWIRSKTKYSELKESEYALLEELREFIAMTLNQD